MNHSPFNRFSIENKIVQWNTDLELKIFKDNKLIDEYYLSPEEAIYKITVDWITELKKYGSNYEKIVDYELFKDIETYLELDADEENYKEEVDKAAFNIIVYRITGNIGLIQQANVFVCAIETIIRIENDEEVNLQEEVDLEDYESMAKRYLRVRKMIKDNPNSTAIDLINIGLPSKHYVML